MAAPVKRASTAPTNTLAPTSPSSTVVGDLVIVYTLSGTTVTGIPTHTLQSGFTEIVTQTVDDGANDGRLSIAYKVATGSGASTYQAYTSSAGTSFSGILVIQTGTYDVGTLPTSAGTFLTTNGAPNPPAVTGLTGDFMILALGGWILGSAGTNTPTAPASYALDADVAGSAAHDVALCTRTLTGLSGASEDPGSIADTVAPACTIAVTVAVKGLTLNNYTITASSGSTNVTGTDAALTNSHILVADPGSITVTGSTAATLRGYPLIAVDAPFNITGTAATLTYTPNAGATITADPGAFSFAGSDGNLGVAHRLTADSATLQVTGSAATGLYGRVFPADPGTYAITGSQAGLVYPRTFAAGIGVITVTGQDATLARGRSMIVDPAAFTITGTPASYAVARSMIAVDSGLLLTGTSVNLVFGYVIPASPGSFSIAGTAATLNVIARALTALPGALTTLGLEAGLLHGGVKETHWHCPNHLEDVWIKDRG